MLEAVMWARLGSRLAALKLASGSRRVVERLSREQTGQDLVEYGGILILVAAIITALFATGIVSDVSTFVKSAVSSIIGSSAVQNATTAGKG
jgi:Flp pilus assembly pilin Flp